MDGLLFYDTLLEYYLGISPGELPDTVWAWKLRYLEDIRKLELEGNKR